MPPKRSLTRSPSQEKVVKKSTPPEIIEEMTQMANEAFGSIEEDEAPTTWVSKEDEPEHFIVPATDTSTALVPSGVGGRKDVSWQLAKAIGAKGCYYRQVESRGDLGVSVFVEKGKGDGSRDFTNVGFASRGGQSFLGAPMKGIVFLMPIAVRFKYEGLPLGTVNSDNALIKKGENGGRLCDTTISAGMGSLMGLPCDCEGGQNLVVKDAMRFISQRIEAPCHRYMATCGDRVLASKCAPGWKGISAMGDNPTLYWFSRMFQKLSDDNLKPSHESHIRANIQAYNGKNQEVMKSIVPHKVFSNESLREHFFVAPVMFRLPMKPEAESQQWRLEESKETGELEVVDLKLIPMSIQQQAATSKDSDLTMELITPDSIESGKDPDTRLHNRYKSLRTIWIMSLERASEFRGSTLQELLEYLKTIDPPTPLTVDAMYNMDTWKEQKAVTRSLLQQLKDGKSF
jgi:hypothetical protein